MLRHGPAGAVLLRQQWNIEDKELLDAVAGHTLARRGMSDFTKLIFLADLIEPNRAAWDGIEKLRVFLEENLRGKTAAFAGASGIGKSTLLNALFPALELSTSEISRKIQRGRHTTRKAELYCIDNSTDCGYIADTPGFSMLDFERFDFFEKEDLPSTMREFDDYIGLCKYTKCL